MCIYLYYIFSNAAQSENVTFLSEFPLTIYRLHVIYFTDLAFKHLHVFKKKHQMPYIAGLRVGCEFNRDCCNEKTVSSSGQTLLLDFFSFFLTFLLQDLHPIQILYIV